MTENEIANKIVGSALEVHRVLSAGLLINFNVALLKNGIKRVINGYI